MTQALIAISDETGASIVPGGARGPVKQEFARAAGEAHLLVSGLPVGLK